MAENNQGLPVDSLEQQNDRPVVHLDLQTDDGHEISGDFAVSGPVLSDSPVLTDAFLGGPASLEAAITQDDEPTHVTVLKIFGSPMQGETVWIHNYGVDGKARTFTIGTEYSPAHIATSDYEKSEGSGEIEQQNHTVFDAIREDLNDNVNFHKQWAFENIPVLKQVYERLGMHAVVDQYGRTIQATFKAPTGFAEGLQEEARVHPETGLYMPNIRLLPAAVVDNRLFVQTFSEGDYPVAHDSYRYFAHDTATDHFLALMVYGSELTDFMRAFADKVISQPEDQAMQFSEVKGVGREAEAATGDTKYERAAIALDIITTDLAGIELDKEVSLAAREVYGPEDEPELRKPRLVVMVHDMLACLTPAQVEGLAIVKYMRDNKLVSGDQTVSAEGVIQGFASMARERFGIELKPVEPPAQPSPADLSSASDDEEPLV